MKILGIETATPLLGVALLSESDPRFSQERTTISQSSHCELVNGFIQELIGRAGFPLEKLDCIAVSIGPGSFTGLRIGIASAMGLAYGLGKPVAPVSTLMALAWPVSKPGSLVCPLIDAKRGEAYAAIYRVNPPELPEPVMEPAVLPVSKLVEKIIALGEPVMFTGPAVSLFGSKLAETIPSYLIGGMELSQPSTLAIAEIGLVLFKTGKAVSPDQIRPVYLRRSDAEIARDARHQRC